MSNTKVIWNATDNHYHLLNPGDTLGPIVNVQTGDGYAWAQLPNSHGYEFVDVVNAPNATINDTGLNDLFAKLDAGSHTSPLGGGASVTSTPMGQANAQGYQIYKDPVGYSVRDSNGNVVNGGGNFNSQSDAQSWLTSHPSAGGASVTAAVTGSRVDSGGSPYTMPSGGGPGVTATITPNYVTNPNGSQSLVGYTATYSNGAVQNLPLYNSNNPNVVMFNGTPTAIGPDINNSGQYLLGSVNNLGVFTPGIATPPPTIEWVNGPNGPQAFASINGQAPQPVNIVPGTNSGVNLVDPSTGNVLASNVMPSTAGQTFPNLQGQPGVVPGQTAGAPGTPGGAGAPNAQALSPAQSILANSSIQPVVVNGQITGYNAVAPDGTILGKYDTQALAAQGIKNYAQQQTFGDGNISAFTQDNQGIVITKADDGSYSVSLAGSNLVEDNGLTQSEAQNLAGWMQKNNMANDTSGNDPLQNMSADQISKIEDPQVVSGAGVISKMSNMEKGMALLGLLSLALGGYELGKSGQFNVQSIISLGFGFMQTATSLVKALGPGGFLHNAFQNIPILNHLQGLKGAMLLSAAITAIAFLAGRLGKPSNQTNTGAGSVPSVGGTGGGNGSGTPSGTSTPQAWWKNSALAGHVFLIGLGVTSLGVGISFIQGSPAVQQIHIPDSQLSTVNAELESAVTGSSFTASGGSFPASPIGNVYVYASGDGVTTPDQVVYVTQDPSGGYDVNKVSLNFNGQVWGASSPNNSLISFFTMDPNTGALIPNPQANPATMTQTQTAMAQVAASNVANAPSAVAAARMGTLQGHAFLYNSVFNSSSH